MWPTTGRPMMSMLLKHIEGLENNVNTLFRIVSCITHNSSNIKRTKHQKKKAHDTTHKCDCLLITQNISFELFFSHSQKTTKNKAQHRVWDGEQKFCVILIDAIQSLYFAFNLLSTHSYKLQFISLETWTRKVEFLEVVFFCFLCSLNSLLDWYRLLALFCATCLCLHAKCEIARRKKWVNWAI